MNASPFRPGDKVVAYCRYSEGAEQGLKDQSTEEQADAIRRFCEQNSLELVQVFADPFASGRSVAKRDHYLEMLSFLLHKKKPDVQGVVLWDFERYGRNYDQAQLDAARLRMAGYKLFSLQQPIVDSGPFSHVLEAMYFASAQNQSDMISADVKRALHHNFVTYKVIPRSCIGFGWVPEPVNMGVFSDGSPRIGYRAVPDPDLTDRIREAVEARLHGASITQCRQIMGAPSNLDVKRLFHKVQLYGAYQYGETVCENYCDPIISKTKFDALQNFEQAHPGRQVGRQGGWSADPPMLSGLLYCAVCGAPMYINRRKSKGRLYCTYRCKNSCTPGVRQEVLDPFIIAQCEEILTPQNIRTWIGEMTKADSAEAVESARLSAEKEMTAISRKIDNAVTLLLEHPSEAMTRKLSELEARRDELQNRLQKLKQDATEGIDADTLYKTTLELSGRILRVLRDPEASQAEKKTALELFVRSIVVAPDHMVVINYVPAGFRLPVVTRPDSVPPVINEKTDGVVTQPIRSSKAPPEGLYSRAQRYR